MAVLSQEHGHDPLWIRNSGLFRAAGHALNLLKALADIVCPEAAWPTAPGAFSLVVLFYSLETFVWKCDLWFLTDPSPWG